MEDFSEFMKERISKSERRNGNCVGSALYITGEIPSESYFSKKDAMLKLSRLKYSSKPDKGYIALWSQDGIPFHAGVILNTTPLEVIHRKESNGLLTKSSLDELTNYIFKNTKLKPSYRIPNKLLETK